MMMLELTSKQCADLSAGEEVKPDGWREVNFLPYLGLFSPRPP